MPGQIQYHYDPTISNPFADLLNRDYYNPAPQGGIPLPPRRPSDTYGYATGDLQYTPVQQSEINAAYQHQMGQERVGNAFYPPAVRAYVGSQLGRKDNITERDFHPQDLNALRQGYDRQAASYIGGFTNPLTGFQKGRVPDVSHFVPFDQYSQEHANARMQDWTSMFRGTAPFSEGAYYERSPEGIRMRNSYYLTPFEQRDVNVLLPMEPR